MTTNIWLVFLRLYVNLLWYLSMHLSTMSFLRRIGWKNQPTDLWSHNVTRRQTVWPQKCYGVMHTCYSLCTVCKAILKKKKIKIYLPLYLLVMSAIISSNYKNNTSTSVISIKCSVSSGAVRWEVTVLAPQCRTWLRNDTMLLRT